MGSRLAVSCWWSSATLAASLNTGMTIERYGRDAIPPSIRGQSDFSLTPDPPSVIESGHDHSDRRFLRIADPGPPRRAQSAGEHGILGQARGCSRAATGGRGALAELGSRQMDGQAD